MKFLAILAALAFCTAPAQAEEADIPLGSLFFTPDEAQTIEAMTEKAGPVHSPGIHLGAIMYAAPQDWALWLQGREWTPATVRPDMQVLSVAPNAVTLSWTSAPGAAPREITLQPDQTYETLTGQIVEGEP